MHTPIAVPLAALETPEPTGHPGTWPLPTRGPGLSPTYQETSTSTRIPPRTCSQSPSFTTPIPSELTLRPLGHLGHWPCPPANNFKLQDPWAPSQRSQDPALPNRGLVLALGQVLSPRDPSPRTNATLQPAFLGPGPVHQQTNAQLWDSWVLQQGTPGADSVWLAPGLDFMHQ